nr:MAG TPA: hypothetical protein [Caudoviricetes sp.]
MGIVFNNSKTKIKFPSGLVFLFCEAIIAQLFCFVNRYRKIFFIHISSHIFITIYRRKNSHIYIYTNIITTRYMAITTTILFRQFLYLFADKLLG